MTDIASPSDSYSSGSLLDGRSSALDQLRMFERKYDPLTTGILTGLGIGSTWRCLELGAGAGSMSRWLANRVDGGSVLAVDLDTQHLDAGDAPTLEVRREDVTGLRFAPGSFDLVLARAVFEHLPDPGAVLARAVEWLAPGGWLVVEDFYCLPPEDAPTEVGRVLVEGYRGQLAARGADTRWARRLPSAMAAAGLAPVHARVTPTGPGQSPLDDELIRLRLEQEGHVLVDNGAVPAEALSRFVGSLGEPGAWDVTMLEVSAWGQRPVTGGAR